MADIGKPLREVEIEPLTEPLYIPEPVPAAPVTPAEPEKVPA